MHLSLKVLTVAKVVAFQTGVKLTLIKKCLCIVVCFPLQWCGFEPESGHLGYEVDRAALAQVFSQYFGFPCQAFQRLLHTYHPGLVQ
jgi:hypothetical protein